MTWQTLQYWLYGPTIGVFLIVCLIWALALFGAWIASLSQPMPLLRFFALKQPLADQIMRPIVRELITLIGAIGLLVLGIFQQFSLTQTYNTSAATLLCQVSGDATPVDVASGISALSQLPGSFQKTLGGYETFLKSEGPPNSTLILEKLPADQKGWTTYDFRLMGLVYDLMAERMPPPQSKPLQLQYWHQAKEFYERSASIANKLPGSPLDEAASRYRYALQSNLAGIVLSLGDIQTDATLLQQARDEYIKLRSETALRGTFLNLIAASSLLGQKRPDAFEDAIAVLRSVPNERRLRSADKLLIKAYATDLKTMHELVPLAEYVKLKYNMEWNSFVDQLFNGVEPPMTQAAGTGKLD